MFDADIFHEPAAKLSTSEFEGRMEEADMSDHETFRRSATELSAHEVEKSGVFDFGMKHGPAAEFSAGEAESLMEEAGSV